jgi:hypothetical protein
MVTEWIPISISALSVILIPLVVLLWRVAVGITKTGDQINGIEKDLRELVEHKEKDHADIYVQMREDRNATNIRLRWLEENLWQQIRQQPHGNSA